MTYYHVTSRENADSILRDGFYDDNDSVWTVEMFEHFEEDVVEEMLEAKGIHNIYEQEDTEPYEAWTDAYGEGTLIYVSREPMMDYGDTVLEFDPPKDAVLMGDHIHGILYYYPKAIPPKHFKIVKKVQSKLNRTLIAALKQVVANSPFPTMEEFEDWVNNTTPDVETEFNTNLESIGVWDEENHKLNEDGQKEYKELLEKYNKLPDRFVIHRSICVPQFEDINKKQLGKHWSLSIVPCWGGDIGHEDVDENDGEMFVLKAKIRKKDVWWLATFLHDLYWGEDEITLQTGTTIKVEEIRIKDSWVKQPFKAEATVIAALKKVVATSLKGWKQPYNKNDLRDAISFLFKKETRSKISENIKFKGYKVFSDFKELDPEGLFYSFDAKKKGWGKDLTEQEFFKILEEDAQRPADFFVWVKDTHADNKLAPLITINGQIADGLGRSLYFHGTGEDSLVAEFEVDHEFDDI